MFTTASPRVYKFIQTSAVESGCLIEHAETRSWLEPYPYWWGQPVQFLWGRHNYGTILLAASILWDVYHSKEIVNRHCRWLAVSCLASPGMEDSPWISLDQVVDLVTYHEAQTAIGPQHNPRCGGCGE